MEPEILVEEKPTSKNNTIYACIDDVRLLKSYGYKLKSYKNIGGIIYAVMKGKVPVEIGFKSIGAAALDAQEKRQSAHAVPDDIVDINVDIPNIYY